MLNYFLVATTLLCLNANISFGQLDSSTVSIEFVENSGALTDSLIPSETMQLNIWVNDSDFVGKVVVNVSDKSSNRPAAKVEFTRQELLTKNYISGNLISIPAGFLSSSGEYKVMVQLQNLQLGYLSPVQINYP